MNNVYLSEQFPILETSKKGHYSQRCQPHTGVGPSNSVAFQAEIAQEFNKAV